MAGFPSNIFLAASAFALLLACGKESNPKPDAFYDEELLPHYYRFVDDARRFGVDLSYGDHLTVLRYGEPGVGYAGKCEDFLVFSRTWKGEESEIDSWSEVTIRKQERRAAIFRGLLFHELGHCLLGRNHTDDPRDIMYPSIATDEEAVENNWEVAVERLFLGLDKATFPDRPPLRLAPTSGETEGCDLKRHRVEDIGPKSRGY